MAPPRVLPLLTQTSMRKFAMRTAEWSCFVSTRGGGWARSAPDAAFNGPVLELRSLHGYDEVGVEFRLHTEMSLANLQLCNLGGVTGFEVTFEDDSGTERVVRFSNAFSLTRFCRSTGRVSVPLSLAPGWNKVAVDLRDAAAVWGARFRAATRLVVFADCHLRGAYFSDQLCTNADLPASLRVPELLLSAAPETLAPPASSLPPAATPSAARSAIARLQLPLPESSDAAAPV